MNRRNFLLGALVGAALVIPTSLPAMAPQDYGKDEKKEDKKDEKKEHKWTKAEDKHYRQYLDEKHEKYRDFQKLNHDEQEQYWTWRDAHPDEDRDDRR